MPLIYTISAIILFTVNLLLKKSEEKLEITKSIIITSVLALAYNTFVCYILNLINIPITLLSLSIINFIISITLIINIIKKKEIQKYTVSKTNILTSIILIIVIIIVTNINFGNLSKIRYISMDAREHYKAAMEFYYNDCLSNKATTNNTTTECFMLGTYTNIGILFKVLNPYIGMVNLYKVYIIFEAFTVLLTGLMFFMLLEKNANRISSKIILIIFSIIYTLGYPLNAWISGFQYLILGILYIEAIIQVSIESKKIEFDYKLMQMFLINFGLIMSYSLFCPFVYLAEFAYYIYQYIKDKNKIRLFLLTLATLILPGIIGITYLILPSFGKVGSYIALDGWLYKNLWSNFIFFIPFAIYAIYISIKNRKLTFENIMFITLIIYMLILFIGTKTGKCSEYYFYKNYFIMWLMLIYLSNKGMIEFIQKGNRMYIPAIFTAIYLIIFTMSIHNNNTYITQESNDSFDNTMEIFTFNKTMICAQNAQFIDEEEIDLLYRLETILQNKWQEEKNILLVTDPTQERWIQSLTGFVNILYDDKEYAIKNLEEENYKYIVTFENRVTYKNMEQYINKENMKIIYENEIRKNI